MNKQSYDDSKARARQEEFARMTPALPASSLVRVQAQPARTAALSAWTDWDRLLYTTRSLTCCAPVMIPRFR